MVVLGGVNGRSLLQLCVTCDQVNAVLFYCLVVEDLVATLVSDGGTGSGGVKDKWVSEWCGIIVCGISCAGSDNCWLSPLLCDMKAAGGAVSPNPSCS